ncbi:putative peroxidase 61 [Silene latifolia]|uniref:putative peroxidase 61 n=1 Tax=Silene latifolia TaxID=37657 RepID=UPI003D76CB9F
MEDKMFLPLMALALVAGSLIGNVDGAITLPRDTLTRLYYKKTNTCENVEAFVKHQVKLFWDEDKTITPKLLRLLYSDCMVTGCDGSVLLDGKDSEKTAAQNAGLGGFVFIDRVKEVVEQRCPGAVSCADLLMLTTRDAVALAGGPSYIVLTGRKDGFSSKASSVDLPSPYVSMNEGLKYFKDRGLDVQDYTTLLGPHSMGKARCRYIRSRLYNFQGTGKSDPTLELSKLQELRTQCPQKQKAGEHEGLVYLNKDSGDKFRFTNSYYKNILSGKGVLSIDQELYYGNVTQQLTQQFADPVTGFQDFKLAFALSMNRMGNYKVLTGKQGEIRRHCHYTNSNNPHLK